MTAWQPSTSARQICYRSDMFELDDTIAAISSSAGSAGRAIVRLSGPRALEITDSLFISDSPSAIADSPGFRSRVGIVQTGSIELPAVVYIFRRPRSYTRQDVVELHIPGPAAGAESLLNSLIRLGAREAGPGEFTARAFFSGRIDLSQAQAVSDVIHASGEAQLRSAIAALQGRTSRLCASAASAIADVLAEVEASIDLGDELIDVVVPAELAHRLELVALELKRITENSTDISQIGQLPRVVIIGRPNAGKSSLLNVLSGTPRAIVSALAGTTRDVLSVEMQTPQGSSVMLQDIAGLVTDARDAITAAAQEAARAALSSADMIILLADASAPDGDGLEPPEDCDCPVLKVANKVDLRRPNDGAWDVMISCRTLEGIDLLKARICDCLHLNTGCSEALGLHHRQKRALSQAGEISLCAASLLRSAAEVSDVAELVSQDLRGALAELGSISGRIVSDDVLGRIFERFCVGK